MYHFNGGEVGEMRRHGEGGRRGEQEGKVRDANLWVAVSTDHLFSLNDSFWYSSSWWSLLLIVDWEGNLCLTTLRRRKGEEEGEKEKRRGRRGRGGGRREGRGGGRREGRGGGRREGRRGGRREERRGGGGGGGERGGRRREKEGEGGRKGGERGGRRREKEGGREEEDDNRKRGKERNVNFASMCCGYYKQVNIDSTPSSLFLLSCPSSPCPAGKQRNHNMTVSEKNATNVEALVSFAISSHANISVL